ncbi:MAG: hypothetical protein AAF985_06075 [Bacteroidota bacterium]
MANKAQLISELESTQALLDIIVQKRKQKVLVRWVLGILFYTAFWHLNWVRLLLWVAIPLELILLMLTILSYFRLKRKIEWLQQQL